MLHFLRSLLLDSMKYLVVTKFPSLSGRPRHDVRAQRRGKTPSEDSFRVWKQGDSKRLTRNMLT